MTQRTSLRPRLVSPTVELSERIELKRVRQFRPLVKQDRPYIQRHLCPGGFYSPRRPVLVLVDMEQPMMSSQNNNTTTTTNNNPIVSLQTQSPSSGPATATATATATAPSIPTTTATATATASATIADAADAAAAGQTEYPHRIHGDGGPTATAPFLQDFSLVAEAAKRAQMAVVMRDLEGVSL